MELEELVPFVHLATVGHPDFQLKDGGVAYATPQGLIQLPARDPATNRAAASVAALAYYRIFNGGEMRSKLTWFMTNYGGWVEFDRNKLEALCTDRGPVVEELGLESDVLSMG